MQAESCRFAAALFLCVKEENSCNSLTFSCINGIIKGQYYLESGSDFMKLKDEFIVHNVGDETLLVPTAEASFHGLVQGNKTVDVILNCLLKDTTEEEILAAMKDRFDGDEEDMRADIADVIAQLRAIGAIDG